MIHDRTALPPLQTGLSGCCPQCGRGHMFDGFLALKAKCEICDLDYAFADPADGPAFFVICFACIPSMLLGVWLEVAFQPAWWMHLIVTIPFMLLTCVLPLRPLKGWLVASQFFYQAQEGKVSRAGQ